MSLFRANLRFFFGLMLVLSGITCVIWQYNKTAEVTAFDPNYQPNAKLASVASTSTVTNALSLPDLIQPEANLKFGIPGNSTPEEEFERLWNYVYKTQFQCPNKEIVGGRTANDWMYGDGAYPLCNEPQLWKGNTADGNRCLVYSFGVGEDFSFDDVMAKKGCEVHSFDPSMELIDGLKRDSGVVFHKIGISKQDNDHGIKGWKMRTLRSLIKELGHNGRYLDYLKVDTDSPEGAGFEDEIIQELLDTGLYKCVRQFGLEIHLPGPIVHPKWLKRCRLLYQQMSQLNERKYRSFSIEDNIKYDKFISKNPNFSQMDKKLKIVKAGGVILWEMAFVNFDPQPCQI